MTEALNPSYESLRDSVENSDVRAAWREGDRWTSHIGEQYHSIAADETLSEEGRRMKEEQVYERHLPKIAQAYTEAREKALQEAKSAEALSIPLPDGKTLGTGVVKDATTMVAIQNETATILEGIERIKARAHKNQDVSAYTTDAIRDAFSNAMETGGFEGFVQARAAIRAGESLGMSAAEITSAYMEQKHYEASDRARRYAYIARTIPGEGAVPKPPSSRRRGHPQGRTGGDMHTGNSVFIHPADRKLVAHGSSDSSAGGRKKRNPFLK
jgi:hypothetical protein